MLQPGQTQVESVAPFVQDDANVATTVSTRTGRLVASELQLSQRERHRVWPSSPVRPAPNGSGRFPENEEVAGGSSSIDVFNPGRNRAGR